MFANSPAVVVLGLLVGVPCLFLLLWSAKNGHFDHPDLTALVIFDGEELQQSRPWETSEQARDRISSYGLPLIASDEQWMKWL